jgi:hypothetical protein
MFAVVGLWRAAESAWLTCSSFALVHGCQCLDAVIFGLLVMCRAWARARLVLWFVGALCAWRIESPKGLYRGLVVGSRQSLGHNQRVHACYGKPCSVSLCQPVHVACHSCNAMSGSILHKAGAAMLECFECDALSIF